ncbi:MAG: hypothetical protein OI860_00535 (plasmid) [Candidatus Methanoperedens sp.]|uniref:hypothetical protein n=1 Tax=Candidatus Methanoperedens sp. BLZ2 TaxID=2035255 RepID=UPI000BE3A2FF|nr:hypothetical protein [Candidatus Methanoperedens sp. BLZ2]KAB2945288.1 MAG: hypothetical protein F9K14_11680 [Candidatus Methanoperedens sp.]MBZ0175566.1 hypothetical protein [Candidatus Methanoperedens nitroreducens]WAH95159.1 MAG: hypothetical protein OI863_00780 [Candidatus Methanoperedens sp.]WAM22281.1 MAG: hypothetical protein OI860_00535 [Candidatus Methanoperedens sp.]
MRKGLSKEDLLFTSVKYYLRPNGSAVINIPKGFDLGLEQGEELVAKWDGSKIVLVPLDKVKFE